MFENLSLPHVLMVIAIALLLFGPKRIPEIAGSMGKGIRLFKSALNERDLPEEPASPRNSGMPQGVVSRYDAGVSAADRGEPKRLIIREPVGDRKEI